jgi:hypothetical protein
MLIVLSDLRNVLHDPTGLARPGRTNSALRPLQGDLVRRRAEPGAQTDRFRRQRDRGSRDEIAPSPQGAPAPPAGKDSGSAPAEADRYPANACGHRFPATTLHEDQQPVDQSGPAIADAPSLVPQIEHPPEPEADDDTDGLEQPGASG